MAWHHERLAEALIAARSARGWTQDDVVDEAKRIGAKVSRGSVQRYERAQPFEQIEKARSTLRGFDLVYQWAPGSSEAYLRGEEPVQGGSGGPAFEVDPQTGFTVHERDAAGRISSFAILTDVARQLREENVDQLLAIARTMFEREQHEDQDIDPS